MTLTTRPAARRALLPFALSASCLATAAALASHGVHAAPYEPRIVGGKPAPDGAYPFMAALVYTGLTNADGQFCGATLIRPDWVLTAAHCVEDQTPGQMEVLLGAEELEGEEGTRIAVSRVIVHPEYMNAEAPDVALLELARPATQAPVDLVGPDETAAARPGTIARTMGWGVTDPLDDAVPISTRLLEVDVPITTDEACAEASGGSLDPKLEICAGPAEGGRDSCYGDSGGPLLVPARQGGGFLQSGIVSYGTGECAEPNRPGVYARVSGVSEWIETTVGDGTTASPTAPGAPMPTGPGATPDPIAVPVDDEGDGGEDDVDPCDDPELGAMWEELFDGFCDLDDPDLPIDVDLDGDPANADGMPFDTAGDADADPADPVPTADYRQSYSGTLTEADWLVDLPAEGFAVTAGTLEATLTSDPSAELVLDLERYDPATGEWSVVAESGEPGGSTASIRFEAKQGLYSWVVYTLGQGGTFSLEARLQGASAKRAAGR